MQPIGLAQTGGAKPRLQPTGSWMINCNQPEPQITGLARGPDLKVKLVLDTEY